MALIVAYQYFKSPRPIIKIRSFYCKSANIYVIPINIIILSVIKRKTRLPQCQNNSKNPIKTDAKSIPLTHKYMTARFPGMVQALQYIVARLN